MIYGFLSLITSTSIFVISTIGFITVINKTGHFLQNMEEEKYKKAFDKFMIETIHEINFSIDSLKLISKHTLKNSKLLFDLVSGNKCIKKDKDGNIIVSEKSKLTEEYKEKIEHLYTKLKKYQNEVKKYKNSDESNDNDKTEDKEKKNDNESDKGKNKNTTKEITKNKKQEINDDSDDTISDDDESDDDSDELEYYLESDK
jgi:hypothetical protein